MERPTNLIVVRHGETTVGSRRIAGGGSNPPLGAMGHAQALELASSFEGQIDATLASTLDRAGQMIAPLARTRGLVVATTPLLNERKFGSFERLTEEDQVDAARDALRDWWRSGQRTRRRTSVVPGMPNDADFQQQIRALLDHVATNYPGQTVVAGSHYDLISTFVGMVDSAEMYHVENGGRVGVRVPRRGAPTLIELEGIAKV